jgi:hypothetical protein
MIIIKNLLKEKYGHSSELDGLINYTSNEIYNYIFKKQKTILNQKAFKVEVSLTNPEFSENIPIHSLKIILTINNVKNLNEIKIGGSVDFFNLKPKDEEISKKTEKVIFNARIDFKIATDFEEIFNKENDLEKEELKEHIKYFFSHELHHLLDYYKKNFQTTNSRIVNQINKLYVPHNNYITNFSNLVYLSLPEEINARVNELYFKMVKYKKESPAEILKKIKNTKQWEDSEKLLNFKSSEILENVEHEELQNFITSFNRNIEKKLELSPTQFGLVYPTEPARFFKKWEKIFKTAGKKLQDKLNKIIFEVMQLDESWIQHSEDYNLDELFS